MAAPVSSAGPGCVKKKTTTSPRPSALITDRVLATSGETGGFCGAAGLVCGLVVAGVAACGFTAGLCWTGTARWALGAWAGFVCLPAAGCLVTEVDGGVAGTAVTALPVSFAERVARNAAAHSARPSRAI